VLDPPFSQTLFPMYYEISLVLIFLVFLDNFSLNSPAHRTRLKASPHVVPSFLLVVPPLFWFSTTVHHRTLPFLEFLFFIPSFSLPYILIGWALDDCFTSIAAPSFFECLFSIQPRLSCASSLTKVFWSLPFKDRTVSPSSSRESPRQCIGFVMPLPTERVCIPSDFPNSVRATFVKG